MKWRRADICRESFHNGFDYSRIRQSVNMHILILSPNACDSLRLTLVVFAMLGKIPLPLGVVGHVKGSTHSTVHFISRLALD
jgi:hypothetical protein